MKPLATLPLFASPSIQPEVDAFKAAAEFERSCYPDVAGCKAKMGPSQEAADRITPNLGRLQRVVLDEVRRQPGTADDLAERTQLSPFTLRPRLSELKRKGLIRAVGARGTNSSSGMPATVWTSSKTNEAEHE